MLKGRTREVGEMILDLDSYISSNGYWIKKNKGLKEDAELQNNCTCFSLLSVL